MLLVNIRPFGNFMPGDEVEVPDGALFDRFYFETAGEPFKPEVVDPGELSRLTAELEAEEGK